MTYEEMVRERERVNAVLKGVGGGEIGVAVPSDAHTYPGRRQDLDAAIKSWDDAVPGTAREVREVLSHQRALKPLGIDRPRSNDEDLRAGEVRYETARQPDRSVDKTVITVEALGIMLEKQRAQIDSGYRTAIEREPGRSAGITSYFSGAAATFNTTRADLIQQYPAVADVAPRELDIKTVEQGNVLEKRNAIGHSMGMGLG